MSEEKLSFNGRTEEIEGEEDKDPTITISHFFHNKNGKMVLKYITGDGITTSPYHLAKAFLEFVSQGGGSYTEEDLQKMTDLISAAQGR